MVVSFSVTNILDVSSVTDSKGNTYNPRCRSDELERGGVKGPGHTMQATSLAADLQLPSP
jgi:hypothetical protein